MNDYEKRVYRLAHGLPDYCEECHHPIPGHQTEEEHAAICNAQEEPLCPCLGLCGERKEIEQGAQVSPNIGPYKGRVGMVEFLGSGYARVRYEDKTPHEYGVYALEFLDFVR